MGNDSTGETLVLLKHATSLWKQWRKDLRTYWPLWLIVAAGLFLRIYEVHRLPGMHGDEAWYGLQARRLIAGDVVEWRTPTGNVPGILHLGALILHHAIFPPALLLLRLPALLSSVGAIALAYVVGRRFFGPTAAMAAATLMASLPVNMAYARLGWDPSHSPLFILAAAYAAFAGRKLLCALLFALALTNHPSAVFAAPFLTLGFFGFRIELDGWWRPTVETLRLAALLLVGISLSIALSPTAIHYVSLSGALSRLVDPGQWAQFGLMFCRLLTGDTIYLYSVGVGLGPLRPWADGLVAAGLVILISAALFEHWRRVDWATAGLLVGCVASLALLYLAAGNWALSPRFERFGFPMVPIAVIAVAALMESAMADRRFFRSLLAILSLPLLAGFWLHYVEPLRDGRIQSAQGFWTGEQDPALSVFRRIAGDGRRSDTAQIIVEDWWLYMPIAYYAAGSHFEVFDARKLSPSEGSGTSYNTYWVTFAGSRLDRSVRQRTDLKLRWTVSTVSRESSIRIWSTGVDEFD